MIEVKLAFSSVAEAVAFLADRNASMSVTGLCAQGSNPQQGQQEAPPKPSKGKISGSAAPAVTASAAAASAPVEGPAPVPTPSPTPPATIDYATSDLPGRIAKLVEAKRKDEVVALLTSFGVKRGPEVPADKLVAFAAALKAVEDKQPEESLG